MLKQLAVVLALVACNKSKDAPPATTGSATGSGSAAVVAEPAPAADAAAAPAPTPYTPSADTSEPIKAAIAAADRTDADRALDAGRKPGEVFTFFKIAPGQKVGELFAGGGYSTELLARIVGDGGKVYAQNTPEIMEKFARKPWTERAAKPVMKNVVTVERSAEDPFPPEAKDLDAVVCILNYHDFVGMGVDRMKTNKAVFAALKPGGVYAIVDHSAAATTNLRDVKTLHRIDEETVKQEITGAGFKLDASSDALRNPADTRDWNGSPKEAGEKRGTTDRFVLRFVKPAKK